MRGQRHTVATGIYKDGIGYEVRVKHRGQHKSQRFDAGTPLAVMQAWQRRQAALIDLDRPTERKSTSFEQDAARYLALLSGRTKIDTEDLLAHWLRLYGTQPRAALTSPIIHGQLLAWHRDGVAAQTCNHRRRVLVTMWRVLDGVEAANPPKACPKLPVPPPAAKGLPWATIQAILDAMGPSTTRARLWVIATTGLPHAMLMRIEPGDLHLDDQPPHIVLKPRRKGAGAPARAIPITPAAVEAFREFVALKAFGAFSTSSMRTSFRLAAAKVGRPDVTPYLLRHSFGARAYAASRDLRAVAELLLHSSLATTKRYAEQAVPETASAAIQQMQADAGGRAGGTDRRRLGKRLRARSSVG